MDQQNVRGHQQEGGAACKPEASHSFTVDDRLAASIPGVRPRVQFLLQVRTPGRIRRAPALLAYLARKRDPSTPSDAFHVRVGFALAQDGLVWSGAVSFLRRLDRRGLVRHIDRGLWAPTDRGDELHREDP
ncbi:MAG: hypothetical protein ACLP1X_22085 [Polyangiaceae bacterium]